MRIILLLLLQIKISFSSVCCSSDNDQKINPIKTVDQDEAWNFEFTLNKFPIETLTNIVSIKLESQSKILLMIEKSNTRFKYMIQNEKKIKQLEYVELGVFQQIFIQYSKQNLQIEWYSDFQMIYNQSNLLEESKELHLFFNEELLCFQQVKNTEKCIFMKDCEEKFHIQIKLYPQLRYLQSQTFNNNYFQIQFWIKRTQSLTDEFQLTIKPNLKQELLEMILLKNHVCFQYDKIPLFQEFYDEIGWVSISLQYQLSSGILKYKRQEQLQNIYLKQSFQDNVKLTFVISENLIFTAIQLQLTKQNNNVLCVPGCLSCDQYGYCLQCEADYIQNGNFCECQENYQFIFSPSECYIKLNYQIEQKKEKTINCPQFGGQLCPQCEDDSNQDFRYCLYLTNIQLSYDQLELEYNYYHLFVAYKMEDYSYLPQNNDKLDFQYTNIIYLSETLYNFYQIGFTVDNQTKCYNGYYYQKRCRQTNKQCRIQAQINNCKICNKNYALSNGKCFKCPKYCQYCQIFKSMIICLRCQFGYFLNFQRKCILCNLGHCEQCYHYNGLLNTLERNFKVQKKGFFYYLGCSYCQDRFYLVFNNRECEQINYKLNYVLQQGKFYLIEEQTQLQFYENMKTSCDGIIIINCYLCQKQICILCNQKHYLDVKNNICISNYDSKTIYNSNQLLQDSDSIFNLLTILYFHYNYTDIIIQQQSYYLKDCQFNNYETSMKIDQIQCFNELNYITQDNQCPFYCNLCYYNMTCLNYKYIIQFQITFNLLWDQYTPYLNYSNNFIQNLNGIFNLDQNIIQLTLLINKIFSSPSQVFILNEEFQKQQLFIKILFNNSQFLEEEELIFSQSLIIENSIINIFEGLVITHNQTNKTNQEGTIKIINVQFIGQPNEFNFLCFIMKEKISKVEFLNVTINNFSNLKFEILAEQIHIYNLTLVNLNQNNGLESYLTFRSQYLIIDYLTIKYSFIQQPGFFNIFSQNLIIKNIQILRTEFNNCNFIITNMVGGLIQIEKLLIHQIQQTYSYLITIKQECDLLYLFDIIISQSKSVSSQILFGNFKTISIKGFNIIDNYFIDTILIFFKSNIILLQNLFQTNNYFRNQYPVMYFKAKLEAQIKEFKFINNQLIGESILFLKSQIVNFDDIYLQNSTLERYQQIQKPAIIIYSENITIKNFQFFDLQTHSNLICFQTQRLHIDNLLLSNVKIIDNQYQIKIIEVLNNNFIQIQDLHISNLQVLKTIEDRFFVHQLFFIYSNHVKLFNILIQNSNTSNVIYFSIQNYIQMNITKLHAKNLSALQLFNMIQQKKISSLNEINNLIFDQANFILPILVYQQQTSQLYLVLTNLDIRNSILISELILINSIQVTNKGFIKIEYIRAYQIQARILIQINVKGFDILIKNVVVLKSKLEQFLYNSYSNLNNILLIDIVLKKINFTDIDKFSILTGSQWIYLSKILVQYCLNFSVLIESINFKIQNMIIANSQIIFIKFQQLEDSTLQSILMYNRLFCKNLQLVNNTQITKIPQISLLIFNLTHHQHYIQELLIFNSSLQQKGNIVEMKGQFISQIFLINNNCESQSLLTNNIYQSINIDINNLDNSSKFINTQDIIRENVYIKLLINSKISIHNQTKHNLLYIPSGQKLREYKIYDFINLRLVNFINSIKIVKYEQDQNYLIQGRFIINTYEYNITKQKVIRNLSQYQNFIQFEQTEQQFGLNDFQLIFNPYQENILMIDIQKVEDPSIQLQIYAKTQICQMGEIFVQDQCLVCDPKLQIYSTKQKSNFCSIVDQQMISEHKQGSIKLKGGYWRPFVYSSIIEICESKQNCKGGWHPGDNSCNVGYLGGNCNACDSFNIRGDGYFQMENLKCKLCGEFNYFQFAFKLSIILIICFSKLVFQMNSNILNYRKHLLQKLVNYRHYFVLAKFISDRSSLVLNILIRNFTLICFIVKDIFDLPEIFTIFTNPIILEKNSSLCLNTFVNNNHQIWIIASKIIIAILTFNLYITFIIITNQKQMKNHFLFPIMALFLFQGPTIAVLYYFIQTRSIQQTIYVTYSNVRYTYFDYGIRYFSQGHQRNLIYFILPLLVSFLIILPLILFLIIKRQAKQIFRGRITKYIGNFILPYRHYYQEIINYFRNILFLQLLLFNQKQVAQLNKIFIIILITYLQKLNRIYKIKIISHYEKKQSILLIGIMYLSLYINHLEEAGNIAIYFISLFYIISSLQQYIQFLFRENKLQLYELLQNRRKLFNYFNIQNYEQCLNKWKNLKLNYKYLVEKKQRIYQNQITDTSLIILQTQNTQEINNSRKFTQEIEMKQM